MRFLGKPWFSADFFLSPKKRVNRGLTVIVMRAKKLGNRKIHKNFNVFHTAGLTSLSRMMLLLTIHTKGIMMQFLANKTEKVHV